jgi:hypothetical protein
VFWDHVSAMIGTGDASTALGHPPVAARVELSATGAAVRVALALAAGGIAVAVLIGTFPDWIRPRPTFPALVVHVAVGSTFAVVGLFAWHRRPHNRVGLLMAGPNGSATP